MSGAIYLWNDYGIVVRQPIDLELKTRAACEKSGMHPLPHSTLLDEVLEDSDSEDEDEEPTHVQQRREDRMRKIAIINSVRWGAHQRIFKSMCMAMKVRFILVGCCFMSS